MMIFSKLVSYVCKRQGRNNTGKITIRHRGGGTKRRIRIVDFIRNKDNTIGVVNSFHYDPFRKNKLALIFYKDGEKRFILKPKNLKIGDKILNGINIPISIGNSLPLKNITAGIELHNININNRGKLVRAAGSSATLITNSGDFVVIKLPSKKIVNLPSYLRATIGTLDKNTILSNLYKAGKSRWLGKRPKVRGSAMNACDHPHGGGEGKTPIGRKNSMTPWGKPSRGVKTKKTKFILI